MFSLGVSFIWNLQGFRVLGLWRRKRLVLHVKVYSEYLVEVCARRRIITCEAHFETWALEGFPVGALSSDLEVTKRGKPCHVISPINCLAHSC